MLFLSPCAFLSVEERGMSYYYYHRRGAVVHLQGVLFIVYSPMITFMGYDLDFAWL